MMTHADFSVAIMGGTAAKLQSILCNQFGTIIITDSYLARGLKKDDAQDKLSVIFLVSNVMSAVVCLGVGPCSDKFKSYKLLFITTTLLGIFSAIMVVNINMVALSELGLLFDISLTMCLGLNVVMFMLAGTILAKLTNERTRGSMFAFNAVIGSIGILILQYFGGMLYSGGQKSAPFLITTIVCGLTLVVTALFWITGKLKV